MFGHRGLRVVSLAAILALAACGGDSGSGGSDDNGDPVEDSCQLVDAAMVQEVFGGTVSEGVEDSSGACLFEITGGPVEDVRVRESGPASSFEGVRSGYHDNFDGSIDVPGIGDEAFHPVLQGPLLLVVRAAGQVFVVNAHDSFVEAPPGAEDMVADLARAIVDRLEG